MITLRLCAFVALALCFPHLAGAQAATESRIALLIGNAAYNRSPLGNPVNDVRLMDVTLRKAGFEVTKAENVGRRDMQRLIRDFGERLKRSGGVGLFYFAGHGVQVHGANYLVPVDADIRAEDEVAYDAIDAQAVLDKMESARNRVNLLILDACRDNPFARSRTVSGGLATMTAPSGSLVAYATAPGSVASDGDGSNGLYTQHLARLLLTPGLPVEEVFKQVRSAVRRDSNNQQTPWENTALEGQFFFRPATTGAPATEVARDDVRAWEQARNSMAAEDIRSYLERFPQGLFADVARLRLASLNDLAAQRIQKPAAALPQAPASQVAAAAQGAASLRGVQVVRDEYTRQELREEASAAAVSGGGERWNTGHEIGPGGDVRAVRISDWTGHVQDGALWKFPLQPGASGSARVTSPAMRGTGEIRWRVTQGNGDVRIVEATIVYEPNLGAVGGQGANTIRGSWTAEYEQGLQVPARFRTNLRGSGLARGEVSTGELRVAGTAR